MCLPLGALATGRGCTTSAGGLRVVVWAGAVGVAGCFGWMAVLVVLFGVFVVHSDRWIAFWRSGCSVGFIVPGLWRGSPLSR